MNNKKDKTAEILDELDRKILYELDMNSRQSCKQIAKKVGSNKNTVNYRIHKLIKNRIIVKFTTHINPAKFGYQNIKVYFQFQNFDKNIETQFFEYLKKFERVGWIVRGSGSWDAIFCYWAKSSFDFYQTFIKILNKFSPYIYRKEVVHNINWFYYNRKWLLPQNFKIQPLLYGEEPGNEKIDTLNKKILKELSKNSRMPIKDIALKLNTSAQNIIKRIKNLRQKGIITKFGIDLNYEKLGLLFCKTFIYLDNITSQGLKEIYDYCALQPNIFALTTTLGAWDLELEFEVSKFKEVIEIMDDLKRKFKDMIRSYESIIITKQSEITYIV